MIWKVKWNQKRYNEHLFDNKRQFNSVSYELWFYILWFKGKPWKRHVYEYNRLFQINWRDGWLQDDKSTHCRWNTEKVQYVDEYEIFPKGFESDSQHPENLPYDEIIAELTENGYNVTRQALEHNYNAWLADYKSGYRDEENGYFIFTPCGCNNLYFNVTKLDDHFDWQYTYIA